MRIVKQSKGASRTLIFRLNPFLSRERKTWKNRSYILYSTHSSRINIKFMNTKIIQNGSYITNVQGQKAFKVIFPKSSKIFLACSPCHHIYNSFCSLGFDALRRKLVSNISKNDGLWLRGSYLLELRCKPIVSYLVGREADYFWEVRTLVCDETTPFSRVKLLKDIRYLTQGQNPPAEVWPTARPTSQPSCTHTDNKPLAL